MGYHKLESFTGDLTTLREQGYTKGQLCGLRSLDSIFQLKKGYPLFIAGLPFSGKTQFVLEILINTSKFYGWKHFIYLGEAGDPKDIFSELCWSYTGKPYIKGYENSMSEPERTYAEMFVNEHFIICSQDKEYTIKQFYEEANKTQNELGITFDTTLFDPFNDIVDEAHLHGNRDDKWLNVALKEVRNSSKKNNRIDILVEHIADVAPITDKNTGKRYLPPALPSEWAKGRTWWRRAFTMLLVYRPPSFIQNENGIPYQENETLIINQKAKPKGIGKLGQASIFWDWKKNRFYFKDDFGNDYYSGDKLTEQNKSIKPNINFYEPNKDENHPF